MDEGPLSTLLYIFIGYVCGLIFAPDLFSPNIIATHWNNVWTYAWIFGWPFMVLWYFLAPFVMAPPAVVVMPTTA